MTRLRITEEMLDELQASFTRRDRTPERFRTRAETEYAWATDTDAYELDLELEKSHVLAVAADDFLLGEALERSLEVAKESRAAAASGHWEGHISLISAYVALEDVASAKVVADEVRKGAADDPLIAEMVGESFELADELALAERWYTIGVRAADRLDDEFTYELLLRDRHRVRRDQSKPLDGFDEEFEALSS